MGTSSSNGVDAANHEQRKLKKIPRIRAEASARLDGRPSYVHHAPNTRPGNCALLRNGPNGANGPSATIRPEKIGHMLGRMKVQSYPQGGVILSIIAKGGINHLSRVGIPRRRILTAARPRANLRARPESKDDFATRPNTGDWGCNDTHASWESGVLFAPAASQFFTYRPPKAPNISAM